MKKNGERFVFGIRNRHFFAGDIVISASTPMLALILRLDSIEGALSYTWPLAIYTACAIIWKPVILYAYGLYRHEWRYASVEEWAILVKGVLLAWGGAVLLYALLLRPLGILPSAFPRSTVLIEGLLAAILFSALRFIICFINYRGVTTKSDGAANRRVLIAGAGVAGSMIVSEMRTNPHLHLEPVCFVDDDQRKCLKYIHGVQVRGRLRDIPKVVVDNRIEEVIIAMPTAPGRVIRDIVQLCKTSNVPSRTIPGVFEILRGTAKVSEFRDIQIDDLLRRGVVTYDIENAASFLRGSRVMVTGAGGSIGAELSRQICKFKPAELILVGHGENSIFEIAAELKRQQAKHDGVVAIRTMIADIRDRGRMKNVFRAHSPQVIFHAAAHKHVGLMEENVPDAVTNNIMGTQILVDLAHESSVERFILISSDKAVNPTCLMGVTKRVAELIVYDAAKRTEQAFVTVRFGNVLGSRGSVVPIFKQQIALGGPITITDPSVTRYFMTIPEAVQLVLKAAELGKGGEVFVLDMGTPIKIANLAHDLIRLSGLEVGRDIDIVYTGLKPGEKLTEELFFASERKELSSHEKIFIARNGRALMSRNAEMLGGIHQRITPATSQLRLDISRLVKAARDERLSEVYDLLTKIVPEYSASIENSQLPGAPLRKRMPSTVSATK